MNWFRVDTSLPTHPRLHALASALGLDFMRALGHMISFWSGVAEHAEKGDLSGVPDSTIELWSHWRGKRGIFVATLRGVGFLDGTTVHGWAKRHDGMLNERERKIAVAKRWREARANQKDAGSKSDNESDSRRAANPPILSSPLLSSPSSLRDETTSPQPPVGGPTPAASLFHEPVESPPALPPATKPPRAKSGKVDLNTLVIPEDLAALSPWLWKWLRYKRERGDKPYTAIGLDGLFDKARELGDRFADAVKISIASNWAGIFDQGNGNGGHRRDSEAEILRKNRKAVDEAYGIDRGNGANHDL